jgi:hypothetical protein
VGNSLEEAGGSAGEVHSSGSARQIVLWVSVAFLVMSLGAVVVVSMNFTVDGDTVVSSGFVMNGDGVVSGGLMNDGFVMDGSNVMSSGLVVDNGIDNVMSGSLNNYGLVVRNDSLLMDCRVVMDWGLVVRFALMVDGGLVQVALRAVGMGALVVLHLVVGVRRVMMRMVRLILAIVHSVHTVVRLVAVVAAIGVVPAALIAAVVSGGAVVLSIAVVGLTVVGRDDLVVVRVVGLVAGSLVMSAVPVMDGFGVVVLGGAVLVVHGLGNNVML